MVVLSAPRWNGCDPVLTQRRWYFRILGNPAVSVGIVAARGPFPDFVDHAAPSYYDARPAAHRRNGEIGFGPTLGNQT